MTPQMLVSMGAKLFDSRYPLMTMWQTIADNFYPIRSDFTGINEMGREFASHLSTTVPVLAHRDLSDTIQSMLRQDKWFKLQVDDELDNDGKRWLDWAGDLQYRMMHMRGTGFIRATKEGDRDFTAFGQCVISVEKNKTLDNIFYRCWHLKDVAWKENYQGEIDTIFRKCTFTARDIVKMFGEEEQGNGRHGAHRKVIEAANKSETAYKEFELYHVIIPPDVYDDSINTPFVSIYIDIKNNHIMEEIGYSNKYYVIPRFQTVSGSQYAHSPVTIAALPEARTIQAMSHTLLEAGERYAAPPMIATKGAVRSDVNLLPNGITWADAEYDERLGSVLRPISQDRGGFPIADTMHQSTRDLISEAFYLNKLTLPNTANMTAYEVQERMKEFVRVTLPLFQPLEDEYNGQICELTFDLMMEMGMLGSMYDVPDSLKDRDIDYKFKSPISDANEQAKGATFQRSAELLATAAAIDPHSVHVQDTSEALRDALEGIGVPAKWLRDEETAEQAAQVAQAEQLAQAAAGVQAPQQ